MPVVFRQAIRNADTSFDKESRTEIHRHMGLYCWTFSLKWLLRVVVFDVLRHQVVECRSRHRGEHHLCSAKRTGGREMMKNDARRTEL